MPDLSPITWGDICRVSESIDVDPCIIQAICNIESSGSGFSRDGRIKIQFEGHVFYRELRKRGIDPNKYNTDGRNKDIIYPRFTRRYVLRQDAEHDQYARASVINEECAILSTSWGAFQIMGFNYSTCGYRSPFEFRDEMLMGNKAQLDSLIKFLKGKSGMVNALRTLNFDGIALRYNGSEYHKTNYHNKLKKQYELCKQSR